MDSFCFVVSSMHCTLGFHDREILGFSASFSCSVTTTCLVFLCGTAEWQMQREGVTMVLWVAMTGQKRFHDAELSVGLGMSSHHPLNELKQRADICPSTVSRPEVRC